MKKYITLMVSLGLVAVSTPAWAESVTNTVSWATEPANIGTYTVRKQVQTGGNTSAPWTALPNVPAGTKHFVDAGNPVSTNVCYEVTPTNTRPSTGTPATKCSMLVVIPAVGPMPNLTIVPALVP